MKEQLTKNFSLSEFQSKDGSPMPHEVYLNVLELAKNLQIIRDYIGLPMIVNSGYRSPQHNKAVGGSPASQHLLGKAADIRVVGMSSEQLHEIIVTLIDEGIISQGGVGLYNTFVHYDIRKTVARWDYRKQ